LFLKILIIISEKKIGEKFNGSKILNLENKKITEAKTKCSSSDRSPFYELYSSLRLAHSSSQYLFAIWQACAPPSPQTSQST
jgi:hypothetical protein